MDPTPAGTCPASTPPNEAKCPIASLSTELVLDMLEFIDPDSLLDFALTCKRFAAYSSNVLRRHQDAFSKYRVASDLSPSTVPTLLRSALGMGDPIVAWHCRSFEVWHDRHSWEDWVAFNFEGPPVADVGDSPKKWKFLSGEISGYLESLNGRLDDEAVEEAHIEIENGKDGALKMLLLASLPRLRSLKFITKSHGSGTCLHWMKRALLGNDGCSYWPPGFSNLRDVAVGVPSETWMDDADLNPSTLLFATLLRLPRLETFYFNELVCGDDEEDIDYTIFFPTDCTSLKHLFLDNCENLPHEFRSNLCTVPQCLQTLAFRVGNEKEYLDDVDTLVSEMVDAQSSLHTIMFYNYDRHSIHGYRCSAYRPEEIRNSSLTTFNIHAQDVELDAYYERENEYFGKAKANRDHYVNFFQRAFPSSLEVLVLWDPVSGGSYLDCEEGDDQLEWIEAALIKAIQVRKQAEDEAEDRDQDESDCAVSEAGSEESYSSLQEDVHYPNLRAVYLEDTERKMENATGPRTNELYFQKLIALGKEAGVDVHVGTNRNEMQHRNEFPEAPDKYSLETGPWWQRRGEMADWEFDVYKGRRVPPGCGKCGACGVCLSLYSKELWDAIAEP